MNTRNKIIVGLLGFGIVLFAVTQFWVLPEMDKKEQQYEMAQKDPVTHDVQSVLKYKHPYMGNAGNLTQLFSELPLNEYSRTYELDSDLLQLTILYKDGVVDIGQEKVERALIYNATTAFALINNLEVIRFSFHDKTYVVKRARLMSRYDTTISPRIDKEDWKLQVQEPLNQKEYVEEIMNEVFKIES
ncbi:hypothetical protein GCM10008967_36780 [Bacillus carboniphilus]|uniref:DUF4825 domain-containing protein n=2 Tax=Bacillus carboniphilus TaxID=86663 RepID=A0ABP3GDM8_9BACI